MQGWSSLSAIFKIFFCFAAVTATASSAQRLLLWSQILEGTEAERRTYGVPSRITGGRGPLVPCTLGRTVDGAFLSVVRAGKRESYPVDPRLFDLAERASGFSAGDKIEIPSRGSGITLGRPSIPPSTTNYRDRILVVVTGDRNVLLFVKVESSRWEPFRGYKPWEAWVSFWRSGQFNRFNPARFNSEQPALLRLGLYGTMAVYILHAAPWPGFQYVVPKYFIDLPEDRSQPGPYVTLVPEEALVFEAPEAEIEIGSRFDPEILGTPVKERKDDLPVFMKGRNPSSIFALEGVGVRRFYSGTFSLHKIRNLRVLFKRSPHLALCLKTFFEEAKDAYGLPTS